MPPKYKYLNDYFRPYGQPAQHENQWVPSKHKHYTNARLEWNQGAPFRVRNQHVQIRRKSYKRKVDRSPLYANQIDPKWLWNNDKYDTIDGTLQNKSKQIKLLLMDMGMNPDSKEFKDDYWEQMINFTGMDPTEIEKAIDDEETIEFDLPR